MNIVVVSTLVLLGLGFLFGVGLAVAAKKFKTDENPNAKKILRVLPGANCGACGYPGCSGLAEAIAEGNAPVDKCPVGGANVAKKIAKIMCVEETTVSEPKVAKVMCKGGNKEAKTKFIYSGVKSCKAALLVSGASKLCQYGCMGLGDCVSVCPFNAIKMGDNGLPVIDSKKCTACGKCVEICPRNVIQLIPKNKLVHVECSSPETAKDVRLVCTAGCIACKICEKTCKHDAIHVKDNLAVIDYTKCTNCAECFHKCPVKVIVIKN